MKRRECVIPVKAGIHAYTGLRTLDPRLHGDDSGVKAEGRFKKRIPCDLTRRNCVIPAKAGIHAHTGLRIPKSSQTMLGTCARRWHGGRSIRTIFFKPSCPSCKDTFRTNCPSTKDNLDQSQVRKWMKTKS